LTFTKLATYSASVVKSNFGNFGGVNPFIFRWVRLCFGDFKSLYKYGIVRFFGKTLSSCLRLLKSDWEWEQQHGLYHCRVHAYVNFGVPRWTKIFTARRSYASAVLGVVILSVCPSVTRVLCD